LERKAVKVVAVVEDNLVAVVEGNLVVVWNLERNENLHEKLMIKVR
jgi:hypothetical protein